MRSAQRASGLGAKAKAEKTGKRRRRGKARGLRLGLPALRRRFPAVAPTLLRKLLAELRAWERSTHQRLARALRWQRAGSVWAADFSELSSPIDGCLGAILVVRDLASRLTLLARPVSALDGESARAVFASLFAEHSAPLVLKLDNGSAFIAELTGALLEAAGVTKLLSPPSWPQYKGSIERSIGVLKDRVEDLASRSDRPGQWRHADLLSAVDRGNDWTRPWGHAGPNPSEAWAQRSPISQEERAAFRTTVAEIREAYSSKGCTMDAFFDKTTLATLEREAITQALEEHDLIQFRRGRITPRLPR